jgi:5-methylcytosine-specific restriction endonuclease McrA
MPLYEEARRQYNREWVAKRRAAYFEDKICVKCGSVERLELDHIDPETKVTNSVWSWADEKRNIELAKCQILCHECHKQKTIEYFKQIYTKFDPSTWKHGTNRTYNRRGCRCEPCRAWKKQYNIKSRLRKLERLKNV